MPRAFPADVRAERQRDARPGRIRALTRRRATAALRSIGRVWKPMFARVGDRYEPAKLVLVNSSLDEACEPRGDWAGLYCIEDRTIYLDTHLSRRDWPYVLAHEVGHHVQELRGVLGATQDDYVWHPRSSQDLELRQELQAECFAGVWAYAIAAPAISTWSGDVDMDATGAAHARWFARGRTSGRPARCDTFTERQRELEGASDR